MAMNFIVFTSSLLVVAIAQQRAVPPAFAKSTIQSRVNSPLESEPFQPASHPFRRVPLPLYRARGFSSEGQEEKQHIPSTQQTFQTRPFASIENSEFNRVGNNDEDVAAVADEVPQQLFRQTQQHQQQQQQQQQAERVQQQQVDKIQQQQQQIDRVQPEKQLSGFRKQPQIQSIDTQPQFLRKVVQRPLKRVQVTEETAASRSPETIQKFKLERSESADKQRAKKPVSQVLRRYRDDNPDGSITWGFENDDGTFKEETIGVDCVTRGKYGYVDPEGVKREYSYQSGVPCDKNKKNSSPDDGSTTQEAQASDTYGYIDYTKNQYVMANGQTINLNGMVKNRARKPVARKTTPPPQFVTDY